MKSEQVLKIVDNIKLLMKEKDLSNNQLSKLAGIPVSTVGRILSGKMNFTVDKAVQLATALNVDIADLYQGIHTKDSSKSKNKKTTNVESLSIGIMSIGRRRTTCIKDGSNNIIATSELLGDLDLAESASSLLELIHESIYSAFSQSTDQKFRALSPVEIRNMNYLKKAKLKLVTQSYEFEDSRRKFIATASKSFDEVVLIPDWQITYLADFVDTDGISLVVDKGVSLSYKHDGWLNKLGGWKFPVYDFGGENWLGCKTIHHTIEAVEGFIPMSPLASTVMAQFNGKIEKITETCFKGQKVSDAYSLFCEPLFKRYYLGDKEAVAIIDSGINAVKNLISRAEKVLGQKTNIVLNGSLAEFYSKHLDANCLVHPSDDANKVSLLADITREFLDLHGIRYLD